LRAVPAGSDQHSADIKPHRWKFVWSPDAEPKGTSIQRWFGRHTRASTQRWFKHQRNTAGEQQPYPVSWGVSWVPVTASHSVSKSDMLCSTAREACAWDSRPRRTLPSPRASVARGAIRAFTVPVDTRSWPASRWWLGASGEQKSLISSLGCSRLSCHRGPYHQAAC